MHKMILLCFTSILFCLSNSISISAEMKVSDKTCINKIKIIEQNIKVPKTCLKNSDNFSLNDSIIILTHNNHVYIIDDVGWRNIPQDKCCNALPEAEHNFPTPIFIERADYKGLSFHENINVLRILRYGRKYLVGELCVLLNNNPPSCFSEVYKDLNFPKEFPSIESLFKPTENDIELTFKTYNYLGGGNYEFFSEKHIISENKIIKQ